MLRWRRSTAVLLACNVLATAMLVGLAWRLPSVETTLGSLQPHAVPPLRIAAWPERPGLDPTALTDNALFYATRRFYVAPPPTVPLPRPGYVLAAVMLRANKPAVAILQKVEGPGVLRVKAGDAVEGWQVKSVDLQRVRLENGPESFDLTRAGGDSPATLSAGLRRGIIPGAAVETPAPAPAGGVRQLGASGSGAVSLASNQPPASKPRLYTPPPPR